VPGGYTVAMDTHANTLPRPQAAARTAVRIAVAVTAVGAPVATYLGLQGFDPRIAVVCWLGLAGSLWAAYRVDPHDDPVMRIATIVAGAVFANGAALLGALGALVATLGGGLCGSGPDASAAWIGGVVVAALLYVVLAPRALAGGLRPLWAWPALVLASVAAGLAVVALVPGSHGACDFG
jgi:hypothetical protein